MKRDNYFVFGGYDLCCWRVAPGSSRVQTRQPAIASILRQRRDCRLVLRSVAGEYLRTFEMAAPLKLAIAFVRRHQPDKTAPNAPINPDSAHQQPHKPAARVRVRPILVGA